MLPTCDARSRLQETPEVVTAACATRDIQHSALQGYPVDATAKLDCGRRGRQLVGRRRRMPCNATPASRPMQTPEIYYKPVITSKGFPDQAHLRTQSRLRHVRPVPNVGWELR
jgi:hypothetical protein